MIPTCVVVLKECDVVCLKQDQVRSSTEFLHIFLVPFVSFLSMEGCEAIVFVNWSM